ncbi:hypothetical protein GQ55_2G444100 [Panicum hallii var. hallii]|uniref:Uncharacterized protein n=1 Tax=Panicum hallii var. hallii TaxID=1504633 RepID=A0A2T7EZ10_9POAL|nr:hypothetical protein GQ55_2G444100 [Panicum hallii var. hallii]
MPLYCLELDSKHCCYWHTATQSVGDQEIVSSPPRVLAQISARKNLQPQVLSAPARSPKQPRLHTTRLCGGLLPPARHGQQPQATGSVFAARALPVRIRINGGGCNRNPILRFSSLHKASAPAWSQCLQCATIQYFQLPLAALCQSEVGSAKTTRREAGHRRPGRRRQLQGGHPWRGGRDRGAALAPDQDVPARLGAAPLRYRQRQRCHRRSQPLQHAGGGRRLHRERRARRQPGRRGRGGHPGRRAPEARHDAGRPVQHQRRHREGARGGGGGPRAGRADPHHQQPGELHGPDRRRGPEAEGRVRPAEAVRRHDPGRGPCQRVRRGDEGPPAGRRRRAGRGRPRGDHHPAAAVQGAPQGGVHGRGGRGAHGQNPERRHRGGGGQGRRRVRDAVDGVRRGAVPGGVAAGARRRRRRVRVRVRAVPGGAGAPVLRVQGEAREGRDRGGGGIGAQGALGVRGARAGGPQAATQGQHRQGHRVRAAATGGSVELNLLKNWPSFCVRSGMLGCAGFVALHTQHSFLLTVGVGRNNEKNSESLRDANAENNRIP